MLRSFLIAGLLSCLPLSTLHAQYDDYEAIHTYATGGILDWSAGEASATGLKFKLGQQLSAFGGVEMQFAMGGEDDTADVSLERLFGLYGRFTLPLERLMLYAKAGFTSVSVDEADASSSEFEIGYGLGVEFNLTSSVFIDLEYMSYMDGEPELDGFSISAGFRFP